jgi:hypothetical protein
VHTECRKPFHASEARKWYANNRDLALSRDRQDKRNESTGRWRLANKAKIKARNSENYRRNKGAIVGQLRESYHRKMGWTEAMFHSKWTEQNGCCAVCKIELVVGGRGHDSAVRDHCHDTGKARGILCATCNKVEGYIRKRGPRDVESYMAKWKKIHALEDTYATRAA